MNYMIDRKTVRDEFEKLTFSEQVVWVSDYISGDIRRVNNVYLSKWVKQHAHAVVAYMLQLQQ
jgi:hypothetical protein